MKNTVTDDHRARADRMIECGLDREQVSQWLADHDADKAALAEMREFIKSVTLEICQAEAVRRHWFERIRIAGGILVSSQA